MRNQLAIVAACLALPALLYVGNPAIALFAGALLTITLSQQLANGAAIGSYSLQTAIVLLGFKLDANYLLTLSGDYTLLIAAHVILTLLVGLGLARLLQLGRTEGTLVASGTAICGGTTIASLSPIIHATPTQTSVAMALVFILNAVALVSFPWIGLQLDLTQTQFGIWAALAIHDTSSVVATANIYGAEAAAVATTLKLGRTLWLIPLILVFSLLEKSSEAKLRIPAFVVLFVLASVIGSVFPMPEALTTLAGSASNLLLVIALFFIGTSISRESLGLLRGKVLVQGLLLWLLVVPLTLLASLKLA